MKGVVRAERLQNPADFVAPMLARVSAEHIQRQYGIKEWTSDIDFLSQLAKQKGKLLKGGEPDLDNVAKSMIYDWQRGKLPFFVAPPRSTPAAGEKGAAGLLEDGAAESDDDDEEEDDDAELEEQEGEEEGLASSDEDEEEGVEGADGDSSVDGDSGVEDSGAEDESVADSDDQEEEEEEEEVLPPPPVPKGGKKAQKVRLYEIAVLMLFFVCTVKMGHLHRSASCSGCALYWVWKNTNSAAATTGPTLKYWWLGLGPGR